MKGLIFENFYILRKQFVLAFILLAICGVAACFSSPFVFLGMNMMLLSMLPITSLVYELEESRMMKIISTMAVSKKEIVTAKYIMTFTLSFLSLIINTVFLAISTKELFISFASSLMMFILGIIMIEIMIPLIFKYGVERGRTLLLVIVMFLSSIVTFIVKLKIPLSDELIKALIMSIPVVFIIISIISYKVALKIFEKAEF